jgi:hypothetical protein
LVFEKRTFLKMSKNGKPRWRISKTIDFLVLLGDAVDLQKCGKNLAA